MKKTQYTKYMKSWPQDFPVKRIRIARPTDQLDHIVDFYCDVIGLEKIGEFKNHQGYDGVMMGLPDWNIHLEFTQHQNGSPGKAPSRDNLLVLYLPDLNSIVARQSDLAKKDHFPVEPENPYWEGKSLTYEDPDGWRIVFFNLNWEEEPVSSV